MKEINTDKNKQILRQIHKDTPVYVPFLLIMKKDFTTNFAFYFFAIFFRFIGLFILTGSFRINIEKTIDNKSFSVWARYLTSYQLVSIAQLSNKSYIIISIIIFVIFMLQNGLYLIKILIYRNVELREKYKTTFLEIIIEHLIFFLYPFLLEYLSFIFYINLLPNTFIIQKSGDMKIFNYVMTIINSIVIIGLNFHGFLHMNSINHSVSEENVPIKYRYSNKKFWVIFLMQNLVMIESLPIYLENMGLKTFYILIFVLLLLILVALFFSSLKNFNYPTLINKVIEACSYFCFFSILVHTLMTTVDYNIKTNLTLFFIILSLFIISLYFQYVANIININMLLDVAKEELFKINEEKIKDTDIYDVYLYLQYLLKLLKFGVKDTNTQNLLNILFLHQQNCISMECKCKLLQLVPYGSNYDKNFVINLTERIGFLIESSFVQLDYSNDYNLSILLSEHYFHSKNNPIMSFSIIQTILNTNQKKLSISQQLALYELAEKYNIGCAKKIEGQLGSYSGDTSKIISMIQKEKGLIDSYMTLDRINKIKKKMLEYSSKYIEILKIKESIEESMKIIKDEDSGEIKSIKSGFLKTKVLGTIIDILDSEATIFKSLILNIGELKGRKLPYCIYYKSFLFIDLFMGGKMNEELLPVLYSFTNDRNLYNIEVNPTVYIILRQRYLEKFAKENSNHTIIFKYTKGMRITYFSDPLASKLGYRQKELKGENIEVLLPKPIANCHSTCVLRYLLINQNRNFSDIGNFMFDRSLQMIESHFWGVCVPGISKNLIIVINLVMREDTPYYYFLFDKNFEIISISTNFYNHYYLSLSLVSKFGINLLKIFDVPREYLRKKFNDEYEAIKEHKYRLGITAEEYFTKRLFKDRYNDIKKFGLLEYLNKNYKVSGRSEDLLKQRINKVKKDLEDMYNGKIDKNVKLRSLNLMRKKIKVIENIINIIDKFTDIDLQNMDYKRLVESRNKLKKFEEEENNPFLNIDLEMKIFIKVLYDQETYLIKFREIKYGKVSPRGMPPESNAGDISITKSKVNKKKKEDDMSKNSIMLTTKSANSIYGDKSKTNNSILKRERMLKSISESTTLHYYKFINYIISGLLLIMLIVYIIILLYQNSMIETSHKIFLSLFYNYYQKDKFMNLFASILYLAFDLLKISIDNIVNIDDAYNLIKLNAKVFEESYHYYYVSYVDLKSHLNEPLKAIYSTKTFSKILNTFQNIDYNSTFIQEVEQLAYLSQYSVYHEHHGNEKMRKDFKFFFSGNFTKYNLTRNNCYMIKTLYYLTKNFNTVLYKYFEEMQYEAELQFDTYSNQSKTIYTIVEVLGFFIYSIFFGVNLLYLHHTSGIIFRNIMNIFLDFTQEGPYSFKNHYDNLIIVKKINEYRAVLSDFNMKNLDKFNEKINKQNALEDSILTDNYENVDNKSIDNNKEMENNILPTGSILTPKKSPRKNGQDMKSMNATLSKSSFLKLKSNNSTGGNNIIAKLNEKPQKNKTINNKTTDDKTSGNLYSQQKDFKKEIVDEELTTDLILNKTYNDGIIQIKILNILLLSLYIIIIIYFFVKLFMSLNFCSDIKRIFNDFGSMTSRSSIVYYYFSSLKILLLVPQFGDESVFNNMKSVVSEQNLKSNEVLKNNIINYKYSQEAFNFFEKSKKDMADYFIQNGCKEDKKCVEIFNSPYNIYLNGLITTLDAILLYTENSFNDYEKLSNLTNQEITKRLIDNDFVKIDLCLNYILNHVQEIMYQSFLNDEYSIKDNYHLIINILNSCAISYSGIIGILIMIFVIRLLISLSSNIQISGNRLNNAFCFIKEKYFRMNSKTEQS